jgi:hypothetical protein
MATAYKVLGQINPSAASDTTLYTVPSVTQTVVSTIVVANLGTTGTYRIAIRPDGAAIENKHYIVYDLGLNANDTITLTLGITIDASDVITVRASNTSFAFSAFGSEIT